MESQDTHTQLRERELRRLTSLADGTVPAWRRARLERRLEHSPALRAELERQRRAVSALRRVDVAAPASLRARVESERADRPERRRGGMRPSRRPVLVGAAAALAVLAVGVVMILSSGDAGPTVGEAAELATRSPSSPAPEVRRAEPALLAAAVERVAFPNWGPEFGWLASGRRTDDLDGRQTNTVFYEHAGNRAGYTIVSGEALEWPPDAVVVRRDGIELHTYREGGRRVVTWLRRDHMCVLSGRGVPRATLLELAAWQGDGAVVT